jgi:AcrR family transcriptional regulator
MTLFAFDIAGDRINHIWTVRNPGNRLVGHPAPRPNPSLTCRTVSDQLAGRQVEFFDVAAEETRERILEVARRLFTGQGYDATSLREIADDLGFTKAALYYHFQSKEQILAALVQPVDEVLRTLVARLEAADGLEEWADALEWVIDTVFERAELFALVDRNRAALVACGGEAFSGHEQIRARIEDVVRTKGGDIGQQGRMIAALAAVTAFDDWAPRLLADTDPAVLSAELVAVTRAILGLRRRRRQRVGG